MNYTEAQTAGDFKVHKCPTTVCITFSISEISLTAMLHWEQFNNWDWTVYKSGKDA